MMWSKVKSLLRKAQPRTRPDLLAAIFSALASVAPQEASGWFIHCGYSFIKKFLGPTLWNTNPAWIPWMASKLKVRNGLTKRMSRLLGPT